jgi:hypothetical protein
MDKGAQFSTEYLVITGIAMFIVFALVVFAVVYYYAYSSGVTYASYDTAVGQIATEADYVASQGLGSSIAFQVKVGTINYTNSLFCGKFVKIGSDTTSSIRPTTVNISGVLPLLPGLYTFYAKAALYEDNLTVQNWIDAPLAFINASYSVSGSALNYDLQFLSVNDILVKDVTFNISAYTAGGTFAGSQREASTSGTYSGSLSLSQSASQYHVYIVAGNYNVFSAVCI